jgi:hypothetical protein
MTYVVHISPGHTVTTNSFTEALKVVERWTAQTGRVPVIRGTRLR